MSKGLSTPYSCMGAYRLMSGFGRPLLLIAATALTSFASTSFASTVSFMPGNANTTSLSIIGSAQDFQIFGVQLSQPTMTNPDFQLSIETNYGVNDLPG